MYCSSRLYVYSNVRHTRALEWDEGRPVRVLSSDGPIRREGEISVEGAGVRILMLCDYFTSPFQVGLNEEGDRIGHDELRGRLSKPETYLMNEIMRCQIRKKPSLIRREGEKRFAREQWGSVREGERRRNKSLSLVCSTKRRRTQRI